MSHGQSTTPATGVETDSEHLVIARRDPNYPFRPFWACVCGPRFAATVMGPALYKEFQAHAEESK